VPRAKKAAQAHKAALENAEREDIVESKAKSALKDAKEKLERLGNKESKE